MKTPPLTRNIGTVEHSLQALLQKKLSEHGLTFPEWTTLVFVAGADRLTIVQLAQRLAHGHIAPETDANGIARALVDRGLLTIADGALTFTPAGRTVYVELRASVDELTSTLFDDLAPGDVETTRRVLDLVAQRASTLLAA